MATVDQARKVIVLEPADYAVLDELVAAGIRQGLIKTPPAKRREGSPVLRAKGETKGQRRAPAHRPALPAVHVSPGAQSRRA